MDLPAANQCPQCGGLLTADRRGRLHCRHCGLDVQEDRSAATDLRLLGVAELERRRALLVEKIRRLEALSTQGGGPPKTPSCRVPLAPMAVGGVLLLIGVFVGHPFPVLAGIALLALAAVMHLLLRFGSAGCWTGEGAGQVQSVPAHELEQLREQMADVSRQLERFAAP